jgi:hypothetical protein
MGRTGKKDPSCRVWPLMGEIVAIAVAIGSAISAAATAVAAVVSTVVSAVVAAVSAAVTWIGAAIASVISTVGTALSDFYLGLTTYIGGNFAVADFVGTTFMTQVGAYVGSVYVTFAAFLEAIHFSTILTIHEIAYIVSDDYRAMWVKVYDEIGAVSSALGFTSEFLYLTLRDARTLVLDVSSTLGYRYDPGEIIWLQEMNRFFKDFSTVANTYKNNPSQLFWDIDQKIVKPNVDNKGTAMQSVLSSVDTALSAAKTSVEDIIRIRDDVDRIVARLPGDVREWVKPMVDEAFKYVDKFIDDIYKPNAKQLDRVITILDGQTSASGQKVKGIIERLLHPADYLHEIDLLPEKERKAEELKIEDFTRRVFEDQTADWHQRHKAEEEKLKEEMLITEKALPPPELPTPKTVEVKRPEKIPLIPRNTWFVGDY